VNRLVESNAASAICLRLSFIFRILQNLEWIFGLFAIPSEKRLTALHCTNKS
jgi:hypothetical protein